MSATAAESAPLKAHLEENGITAAWLIRRTGIRTSRLYRLVAGTYLPNVEEARAICTALGLRAAELGWSTDPADEATS